MAAPALEKTAETADEATKQTTNPKEPQTSIKPKASEADMKKMMQKTSHKELIRDLEAAKTKHNKDKVDDFIVRVKNGEFYDGDDLDISPHTCPKIKLFHGLLNLQLHTLAENTENGMYDDD